MGTTNMSYPLYHFSSNEDTPMVMTLGEFAAAYPGEGDYIEFKRGMGLDRIREAVTAFSNADGGVVLIGVDNEGHVIGHELDGEGEAKLHRLVGEVSNPGRYDIHSIRVEARGVTVLAIDRRREGFAQTPDGVVRVRKGASNPPLFGGDLNAFMSKRSLTRFETTPTDVPIAALSKPRLYSLAGAWGWPTDSKDELEERLLERGLAVRQGRGDRLTIAGVLYLLDDPAAIVGKAYIEVFRYKDQSNTYDKRTVFGGPLNDQVEAATNAVMAELGAELIVLGMRRYELEPIPNVVLREAIANAVAHRDYETGGTATRVEIRPDSVTIISPGGLPEPVTVANIREQQAARNVMVIDTLRRFRLAEDAGQGVDLMQDSMLANMLHEPEFADEDGKSVRVTLRIGSTVTPTERAWLSELEKRGDIAPRERILLVHAARGEGLTNSYVRDLLGVDSVDARSALQRLRDIGLLIQTGSRGGATYLLAGDLAPPAGLRLGRAELADLIESLAHEGPVTNKLVRDRTGLDRASAVRMLSDLVQQGRLRLVGSRRGARYVLPRAADDAAQLPFGDK
jgi:ATP-dependent DNA helicase RecG